MTRPLLAALVALASAAGCGGDKEQSFREGMELLCGSTASLPSRGNSANWGRASPGSISMATAIRTCSLARAGAGSWRLFSAMDEAA